MHAATKAGLFLTFLAALGGGVGALVVQQGILRETPPGFRVGGREVDPAVSLGEWIDARRSALAEREVVLVVGGEYLRATAGQLGVEVDVGATLREARGQLDSAGWWALRKAAREGEVDVPLAYRVDEAKARGFLEKLAPQVHRDPQNARLDLMNHARIEDVPGADLDVGATVERLRGMGHVQGEVLELATRPIKAAFTTKDIANIDVSKVLSSAETGFTLWGTGAGRAVNIATAAKRIDGWVLAPGETLSFNQVVGPRTLEAGFTYAPEIVGDELEMGVGGGTCQVASTLHVASVMGAMDIVERVNHGRPSSYTKMGMDATVAYGKVDLRIRNPFSFPVILHAFLPKPTVVRVEILGADPQAKVSYSYAINKSDEFFRRITYKPHLPQGKVVLHQKGIRGYEVISRVTMTWNDGRVSERSYFSGYRPVPEVLWVGRDVDDAALPELPEGATRVEHRGFSGKARPGQAISSTDSGGNSG